MEANAVQLLKQRVGLAGVFYIYSDARAKKEGKKNKNNEILLHLR